MSAKRWAIGVSAVAVTLGGVAVTAVPPASARAPGVTIHAAALAGYGAIVHLTGTAPAGSAVSVYFHRKGSTGYVKRRTLTADPTGQYATTYIADTDYRYYATTPGAKSSTGLTKLPTVTCTTSPAIPGALAFPPGQILFPDDAFAVVQATNGKGQLAGFAYDSYGQLALITRKPGHSFTAVARYNYPNGLSPSSDVHVDAVTAAGGIVVDIRPSSDPLGDRHVAYVYSGGHRYQLKHSHDWRSVVPIGVTAAGTIVGVSRSGRDGSTSARYAVVTWAGASAPYKVVARTGAQNPSAAVAANGVIGYSPDSGKSYTVQFPGGRIAHFGLAPGGGLDIVAAGDNAFYGFVYDRGGSTVAKWSVASPPTSGTTPVSLLSPPDVLDWLLAAGRHGDVITYRGYQKTFPTAPRYLRTARGALARIPAGYRIGSDDVAAAIDGDGSVAFTSAADRLPHLLRCH